MPINIGGDPGDYRHFFNYMSLEFEAYFWFNILVNNKKASRHTENKTDRKKVNFNFKSLEESKRKCNNNSIIRKGKYSMKEIRGSPVREEE